MTRPAALHDETLARAELDFAAATAARGADGRAEAFDAGGAMWRNGRVEGHEAVRAKMIPMFAGGTRRLEWTPRHGGPSPAVDLGFTAGDYEMVVRDAATNARTVRGRGAYLSVWRRQPDGAWKVLFDTGNPAE